MADEAWAELGEIPKEDVALIREKADFDIDRILEIEQQTRHDVVAFTRAVSETLGEERKWVHYGLTTTAVKKKWNPCWKKLLPSRVNKG